MAEVTGLDEETLKSLAEMQSFSTIKVEGQPSSQRDSEYIFRVIQPSDEDSRSTFIAVEHTLHSAPMKGAGLEILDISGELGTDFACTMAALEEAAPITVDVLMSTAMENLGREGDFLEIMWRVGPSLEQAHLALFPTLEQFRDRVDALKAMALPIVK